jgi:hypothetical protein
MYKDETWERINAANSTTLAGMPPRLASWTGRQFSVAERDQIDAAARDMDRAMSRYPVIHAWPTEDGSQLTFWCQSCKGHHVHGRHASLNSILEAWGSSCGNVGDLWLEYLKKFEACNYNPNWPGGRGFCTCPVGTGNGHRIAHCWNSKSPYYDHGYYLHAVPPNDVRALRKPQRVK